MARQATRCKGARTHARTHALLVFLSACFRGCQVVFLAQRQHFTRRGMLDEVALLPGRVQLLYGRCPVHLNILLDPKCILHLPQHTVPSTCPPHSVVSCVCAGVCVRAQHVQHTSDEQRDFVKSNQYIHKYVWQRPFVCSLVRLSVDWLFRSFVCCSSSSSSSSKYSQAFAHSGCEVTSTNERTNALFFQGCVLSLIHI